MSAQDAVRQYAAKQIDRREFMSRLLAVGVTAGAAHVFAEMIDEAGAQIIGGVPADLAKAPRALAAAERKTVEAIAARLIPTTDTPGAIEAGAVDYIDIALGEPYKAMLARYQRGIVELDKHCMSAHGKSFAELQPAQQDTILDAMEEGKIAGFDTAAAFFDLVRRHVMEGFFCEPYYGGNKDMIGWKLVGFPGMRYGYEDAYNNKRIDLAPVAGNHPPRKGE